MFNLLPQEEQDRLLREYRLRLAGLSLFFLAGLGVVSLLMFIPSLLLSKGRETSTEKLYEDLMKEAAAHPERDLLGALKIAGQEAQALKATVSDPYAYEVTTSILNSVTPLVKISGITVARAKTAGWDAIVTGRAHDRESLLSFTRSLENEPRFQKVDVPVSNFAADTNILFSILITVRP